MNSVWPASCIGGNRSVKKSDSDVLERAEVESRSMGKASVQGLGIQGLCMSSHSGSLPPPLRKRKCIGLI